MVKFIIIEVNNIFEKLWLLFLFLFILNFMVKEIIVKIIVIIMDRVNKLRLYFNKGVSFIVVMLL